MRKDDAMVLSNNDKERKFRLGYVYIIKSPAPDELMRGISEGKLIREALDLINIECIYKLVVNRDCFERAIKVDFKSYLRTSEINPIVHISAHGISTKKANGADVGWLDCPGIVLTNGDELYWEELSEYLIDINNIVDGNLIVCMSCCYGYGGLTMSFSRSKKLPYFALIGNMGKYDCVSLESHLLPFITSYLARVFLWGKAVEKMAVASGNENFKLIEAKNARAFWLEINRRAHTKRQQKNMSK